MRINTDPILKEILVKAANQILKERTDILALTNHLLKESNKLRSNDDIYRNLSRDLRKDGSPRKWFEFYMGLLLKFGILESTETSIYMQLKYVLETEGKISKGLNTVLDIVINETELMDVAEQQETMQKLADGSTALAKLKTQVNNIKNQWNSLKVDVEATLKACIRWLQILVIEGAPASENLILNFGLN